MRYITLIRTVLMLALVAGAFGCKPQALEPKVEYVNEIPEGAAQHERSNISEADLSRLRSWQPGSTMGNNSWSLQTL